MIDEAKTLFAAGMAVAAGVAAPAAADDWSFSSSRDEGQLRCYATPGDQTGSTTRRLALDDDGLAVEVENATWSLETGSAYRSALIFDGGEEERAIADVLSATTFRVLLNEADDGEARARTARRIAVKRGDGAAAPYFVLESNSIALAISELGNCRLGDLPAGSSGATMSAESLQMKDYVEIVFDEPMNLVADTSNAMLFESENYTVFLHRENAGASLEQGHQKVVELALETFPDCGLSEAEVTLELKRHSAEKWTVSSVENCLGKDLVISGAFGPAFFNASFAINHGARLTRSDLARKLEVASLLQ